MRFSVIFFAFYVMSTGILFSAEKVKTEPEPKEKTLTEKVMKSEGYLGRTIRLQFKLVPEEDEESNHWVLVSTKDYSYSLDYSNAEFDFGIKTKGRIAILEDNRILIAFKTVMDYKKDAEGSSMKAEGSVVVEIGKSKSVAQLGDKTLVITVTDPKNIPVKAKVAEEKGVF
ncbi:MAG: hypothetical protein ACYTFY_08905 [Planctomycetota bacterium]|jgi:hypothetical protein